MRDALYKQLEDLRAEMGGISPKLSLFAKLKRKEDELLEQLGGENWQPETPKAKQGTRLIFAQKPEKTGWCIYPGCESRGKSKGKNHRGRFCVRHLLLIKTS